MDINWQLNINDEIKDNNRDLTITEIKIEKRVRKSKQSKKGHVTANIKWYKYKCNKCGYNDGWIDEKNLISLKQGCSCCSGKTIARGINDIATTMPYLVKYLSDKNDAYIYSQHSGKKILFKCPDCGNEKIARIYQISYQGYSCSLCSDGISYPEKFVISLLEQLNIKYKTQLNKSDFEWCNKFRYDFYLSNEKTIVEVNGGQHYSDGMGMFRKKFKEQYDIDMQKQKMALENGIKKYIRLDCRISDCNHIKNSIMTGELPKILNFKSCDIDWSKCEEYANKSLLKEICNMWNLNNNCTSKDIANKYNIARSTVIRYLNTGKEIGLCNYNPKEEMKKSCSKNGKSLGAKVEVIKDDVLYGAFNSMSELSRKSESVFGFKMHNSLISTACHCGKLYNGYQINFIK